MVAEWPDTARLVASRDGQRADFTFADGLDPHTRDKIEQITQQGYIARHTVRKARPRYSKKALQLELRDLTIKLGRLPTPEDVQQMGVYSLDAFLQAFPTWGKALKAAKMEVGRD
jgi:hypothetical protein